MNRRSPESTPRPSAQAGWRGFLAGSALALVVLVTGTAMPTSAADKQVLLNRLEHDVAFQPARRGATVTVAPPPKAPTPPPPAADPPPAPLSLFDQYAREVIRLTNVERQAAGVPPVTMIAKLNLAADVHARDMASKACALGVLSHTGSDGSNAGDRILRTGLGISWWSENIGCGQGTPEHIVRSWMKSPGHRKNLLNPTLTHIGVGVAESDLGLMYWVQNFAILR